MREAIDEPRSGSAGGTLPTRGGSNEFAQKASTQGRDHELEDSEDKGERRITFVNRVRDRRRNMDYLEGRPPTVRLDLRSAERVVQLVRESNTEATEESPKRMHNLLPGNMRFDGGAVGVERHVDAREEGIPVKVCEPPASKRCGESANAA